MGTPGTEVHTGALRTCGERLGSMAGITSSARNPLSSYGKRDSSFVRVSVLEIFILHLMMDKVRL